MKKPFITYLGVMIHPSNLNMTPDFKLSHFLKMYLLNQNCYDKHKSQIRQEVKFQHTQITLFVETFVIVVLTQVYIFQVCTQHLALCISLQSDTRQYRKIPTTLKRSALLLLWLFQLVFYCMHLSSGVFEDLMFKISEGYKQN